MLYAETHTQIHTCLIFPFYVWLDPLKDYQAVKERAIITRVTVPNDYLPFCMEDFEALDSQGPAEKPKQKKPFRPKLTSKPLKAKKRPSQRART